MPEQPGLSRGQTKRLGSTPDAEPRTGEILGTDTAALHAAMAVACAAGCGLLISPTSDGGALSVTLYAGDQRHRGYASSSMEFQSLLQAVRDVSEAHLIGGPMRRQNGPLRATQ